MAVVGIIIDVALVLAVVIFAIIGLKKGFFKSFFSLFSWVVCLIVALLVAKYVARWINGIHDFGGDIGNALQGPLTSASPDFFGKAVAEFGSADAVIAAIPAGLNGILATLTKSIFTGRDVSVLPEGTTVAGVVGSSIGWVCMMVISAILVFVVLKLAVWLLSKLFENLARTKVIGGLNRFFGLLFGIVKAGLIIFAINIAVVFLTLIPVVNQTITPLVNEHTYIEKFVYNQADTVVDKYIIHGNIIETWIASLWDSRK